MKISVIIIALSVLITVAVAGCISGSGDEKPPADLLEPRVNSEAEITISATYLPDITDATVFEIKVTAHKNYDDDFKNNSFLRDSSGKTYQAISYEGEGGHHASGTLRFPKIESKRFELVIRDVAGVKERVFKW